MTAPKPQRLSPSDLRAIHARCVEVASHDTSANCGPDPHPSEQHQAPESARDVARMAAELIVLREQLEAIVRAMPSDARTASRKSIPFSLHAVLDAIDAARSEPVAPACDVCAEHKPLLHICDDCCKAERAEAPAAPVAGEPLVFAVGDEVRVLSTATVDVTVLDSDNGDLVRVYFGKRSLWVHPSDLVLVRRAGGK